MSFLTAGDRTGDRRYLSGVHGLIPSDVEGDDDEDGMMESKMTGQMARGSATTECEWSRVDREG